MVDLEARVSKLGTTKLKQRLLYGLKFKCLFLVGVPSFYCLIAGVARSWERRSHQDTSILTGRRLLGNANCTSPAIEEFPPDLFTEDQKRNGAVTLHLLLAFYLFLLLAVICEEYFVPSIKRICEKLGVPDDVAGATFMAAATSSPELFINGVGTFITEGDIGVGTIVGSAVFNILAVPACCGLFANQVITLHWWPISRDCLMYGVAVVLLIFTLEDSRVEWYEALVLVSVYLAYLAAMYYNAELSGWTRRCFRKKRMYRNISKLEEIAPLINRKQENGFQFKSGVTSLSNGAVFPTNPALQNGFAHHTDPSYHSAVAVTENNNDEAAKLDVEVEEEEEDEEIEEVHLWSWSHEETVGGKVWWVIKWPIQALLYLTIPDCRKLGRERWFPATFTMCIVYIAVTSYMVAWMITVVGDAVRIPDSVMGLTFLAAGMSVPEAVSSVLVSNQGLGAMGISNSIGSNTFDVLLCLGLPWLVKSTFMSATSGHFVQINSDGILFSTMSLLSTLVMLYATFALNKFKLDRKVGVICLVIYACFLVFASVIELNVFFDVNPPTCGR